MYQPLPNQDPRCWCCWETSAKPNLIRACHGCKDPDLQYVHHECIQKHLTNVVMNKHPKGQIIEPVPFISSETIRELETYHQSIIDDTWRKCNEFSPVDFWNKLYSLRRLGEINGMKSLAFLNLRCSRCLDDYIAVFEPLSPFYVLMFDKILRVLVTLMLFGLFVLLVSTFAILRNVEGFIKEFIENGNNGDELMDYLRICNWSTLFIDLDIRIWAKGLIIVFSVLTALTTFMVLWHCRGYNRIKVLTKDVQMTTLKLLQAYSH